MSAAITLPAPADPICIAPGCVEHATWTREESLHAYCSAHIDEWLMAEASIARRDVGE